MRAFPRVPVEYGEGKPGNVFVDFYCSERPGNGAADPSRPDSFAGSARRGEGNPGQGTGETLGDSADLYRRPFALSQSSGHTARPGGQGPDGAGRTGSGQPGQRDGRGPAAAA